MKKIIIISFSLITIFVFTLVVLKTFGIDIRYKSKIHKTKQYSQKNESDAQTTNQNINNIKIIGVGDIMLGTNFPNNSYLPPNDGRNILKNVEHILKNADITFGNLEGVFLTQDGNVKTCDDPKVCYSFKMPDHYVRNLELAGFDILSIANNHIGDFGKIGIENTINVLNLAGINYAGLNFCPFTIFEKNGIKYGFTAFAPNPETLSINDYEQMERIVPHLDSICDIVIVSFHGGAEGKTKRNLTFENEIFLEENRGNPNKFARAAIDAGADIIFGHGPHVTRAIDIYKEKFIAYSLGNFATYGRFNISGVCGVSPIIELEVNNKGNFIYGKITSTRQIGRGIPVIDIKNKALIEIIELTKQDIPNCNLIIKKNGFISIKKN